MLRGNVLHLRVQLAGPLLQRFCHTSSTPHSTILVHDQQQQQQQQQQRDWTDHRHDARFAYYLNTQGHRRVDRDNNEWSVYVGRPDLPAQLKESLGLWYAKHHRKQIITDGLKLERYIMNRGRPTLRTIARLKEKLLREGRYDAEKEENRLVVTKFRICEETGEEEEIEEDSHEYLYYNQREAKEKSRMERSLVKKKMNVSMIRYQARETAAFSAVRLEAVYGSTYKVLSEIKRRDASFKPTTLLDFGSGCGMTVWAAHALWCDDIKEYQCVEPSEHMNTCARFLLTGDEDEMRRRTKIPHVFQKRFLPFSNELMYDVVVCAYTLSEIPLPRQRLEAIRNLWQKTEEYLVIVEMGNTEGYEIILQARDFIISTHVDTTDNMDVDVTDVSNVTCEEGHIFAPCSHEQQCPRSDPLLRDHPCTFEQKVDVSFAQSDTPVRRRNQFLERFSYIVFRKGPIGGKRDVVEPSAEINGCRGDVSWSRLLKPIKKNKGHVICEMCCANGNIEKHCFTKSKDPYVFKAARELMTWGDRLPLDEQKKAWMQRIPTGERMDLWTNPQHRTQVPLLADREAKTYLIGDHSSFEDAVVHTQEGDGSEMCVVRAEINEDEFKEYRKHLIRKAPKLAKRAKKTAPKPSAYFAGKGGKKK